MYYALTINAEQIITGVHESLTPITSHTFMANPVMADDTVILLDERKNFITGEHIFCYNEDGTRKSDLWCIENGYMEMPPNKEIINGELVDRATPMEEQPQTLQEYLEERFYIIQQESREKITAMKPLMTELVKDKSANIVISASEFILDWVPDSYVIGDIRKDNTGYPKKCINIHNSLTSPDHTIDVASLWAPFHATQSTYALPWIAPTGAHDMYKIGEYMVFTNGKMYKCIVDTNFSPTEYAPAWVIEGEEPVIPEELGEPEVTYNSNGTVVGSNWVSWNGYPATLYQIGDIVIHSGTSYIATTGNNHWEPGVFGWNIVPA